MTGCGAISIIGPKYDDSGSFWRKNGFVSGVLETVPILSCRAKNRLHAAHRATHSAIRLEMGKAPKQTPTGLKSALIVPERENMQGRRKICPVSKSNARNLQNSRIFGRYS